MNINKIILSGLALSFAVVTLEAGTLKGHVKYAGKAPKSKKLRMDADPVCDLHIPDQFLVNLLKCLLMVQWLKQ